MKRSAVTCTEVGVARLERTTNSSGKTAIAVRNGSESGPLDASIAELEAIVEAWPTLSHGQRDAILAIAGDVLPSERSAGSTSVVSGPIETVLQRELQHIVDLLPLVRTSVTEHWAPEPNQEHEAAGAIVGRHGLQSQIADAAHPRYSP